MRVSKSQKLTLSVHLVHERLLPAPRHTWTRTRTSSRQTQTRTDMKTDTDTDICLYGGACANTRSRYSYICIDFCVYWCTQSTSCMRSFGPIHIKCRNTGVKVSRKYSTAICTVAQNMANKKEARCRTRVCTTTENCRNCPLLRKWSME